MFEFRSWYIFLLFFIYSAYAVSPEKDTLITFYDDDDGYDSDLMEEDYITPLFEPSSNSEKNKIDPKLLIKAEYDWREAEKLLMKYAYPTKRWDEINDDDIMPVDDDNDDIFVMEGKKHVCSILIRDRNAKNNKFEPITHSLFRSKNIEIPVWESNRYETRKLLCITFPYCTWQQLHVKVVRCICNIISGSSTTYAITSAEEGQIKPEQMENGALIDHMNVNLGLMPDSPYSTSSANKELLDSSEVPSTPKSEPNYPFGIRKSCNPLMGSLLGLGRLNEQLLGDLPGLTEEHKPISENSVGLEKSNERGLGTLLELMEIPEPKSIRSQRVNESANNSLRQTGDHRSEMEVKESKTIQSTESNELGTSSKAIVLRESSEAEKAIVLKDEKVEPIVTYQLPPSTYALDSENICIYGGIRLSYVYFSRGVSGENSFFVYGKSDESGMLRVVAHLILPEVEDNNNDEQLT